ncbi:MAG: hypothetical protein MZV63_55395 [Marinilabiliales bacterium]|nr:hypothetical protein [Marinilabiliales bacterium]
MDLPSFGYSGRYPELNQSNSNRARLVWMLKEIDGAGPAGWIVVGHSMGQEWQRQWLFLCPPGPGHWSSSTGWSSSKAATSPTPHPPPAETSMSTISWWISLKMSSPTNASTGF